MSDEIKLKPLTKRDYKNLKTVRNMKGGITIWAHDNGIIYKNDKHWVLDASCVLEDGEINLGRHDLGYKYVAVFDKNINQIKIMKTR